MTPYRVVAGLMPTVLPLVWTAFLVRGDFRSRGARRIALDLLISALSLLVLLAILWAFSGERFSTVASSSGFCLSAGAGFLGLYSFLRGVRLPPAAAQIGSGVLALGMMSSLFVVAPLIQHGQEAGWREEELIPRLNLLLAVNPFVVESYSVFGHDLLRDATWYSSGAADYPFVTPGWTEMALCYLALGALTGGIGVLVSRAFRRGAIGAP